MKPHPTAAEIVAALDVLARSVRGTTTTPDKLVAYPFDELGIVERNSARELASRVPVVRLGRRRYAKCSDLLRAIDELAAEQAEASAKPTAKTDDATGSYLALVQGSKR